MRRALVLAGLWGFGCAALMADGFWESKPFMSWSDQELQQMVTDSPWAQKMNVVLQGPPVPGGEEGGGGGRGGAPFGGTPGGATGVPGLGRGLVVRPQLRLTVSWRSALPLKQALVRSEVGAGGAVPADSQAILDRSERFYVLTVTGLPSMVMPFASATDTLKAETRLKRDNKPPISPEEVIAQPAGNLVLLVFTFPKTEAITLEDKRVEFVTKLGMLEIKKKFTLKDLVFHGRLEL